MKTHLLGKALFGAFLTLISYSAVASNWPPVLDSDPEVEPPKWDWQLDVPVKINPDSSIKIYDIEMFENEDSGAVQMLHDRGYKVICYIDVGSWENWRDDKDDFPTSILGTVYEGFADERWLDIRDVNPTKSKTNTKLATILEARFDRAVNMGCDAVEPDNVDGYDITAHESSGFPLTYEDQIYFNLWVANAVHDRGMLVALKNDINQAHDSRIYNTFDFVVSEQCFQYNECDYFSDFLAANKPVFETEYKIPLSRFCPEAKANRISAIKKRTSLNTIRKGCSSYYSQPPVNENPTAAFTATCSALVCSFTDTSTDNGSVTTWSWDFGDGGSANLQNPIHTYGSDGTYTVKLTVTDDESAINDASESIIVNIVPPNNLAPSAVFIFSCNYLNCDFTDTSIDSDGSVIAWNWNFGDSSGGAQQNPSHTFSTGGSYTVSLIITDNDGSTDNTLQSVTVSAAPPVNQAPTAAFTSTCINLNCDFTDVSTDSDGNITVWRWDFGDGSNSELQNVTHTYDADGIYTVILNVTDNEGETNNVTHTVTINSDSKPSTTVYYPGAVNIVTGSYDWGTLASLIAPDSDTYDIRSASAAGGKFIDWSMTTVISESPDNITLIKVTNIGQYSRGRISQKLYIYNFKDSAWELVDTSTVGNQDDVTVSWVIGTNVSDYISAQGQLRMRTTAFRNSKNFYSWSNALYWEVTQM